MCLPNYHRYFILLLGLICLSSIASNMIALNFTLICMSKPAGSSPIALEPSQNLNLSTLTESGSRSNAPTFEYTSIEKSWLMWSVGIGSLAGTFPFSWLCNQFGARYVVFGAGILSAFATALIPLAAIHINFATFLVLRFLQGITYSADFAAIGMICNRWASLKQYALFIGTLTSFTSVSTSLTNSISGVIWLAYGVLWACCGLRLLLMGLWLFFYTDHPDEDKYVTSIELEKIHRNKTKEHIEMDKFIPYRAILTDKVIWIMWLNAFVDIFSGVYITMYIPSYFKYVLNYGVVQSGFLGALPTLIFIPCRIIFSLVSDKIKCMSEHKKLVLFNTLSVAVPGMGFLAIGFVPSEFPGFAVIIFIGLFMFLSVSSGGFYKSAAFYSRQYYHFVVANIQFVKSLTLFLAPTMMAIFVHDETRQEQWRTIFIILAITLIIANILFCFIATDEPAVFTKPPQNKIVPKKASLCYSISTSS